MPGLRSGSPCGSPELSRPRELYAENAQLKFMHTDLALEKSTINRDTSSEFQHRR